MFILYPDLTKFGRPRGIISAGGLRHRANPTGHLAFIDQPSTAQHLLPG
jgi:hypothetical protein